MLFNSIKEYKRLTDKLVYMPWAGIEKLGDVGSIPAQGIYTNLSVNCLLFFDATEQHTFIIITDFENNF